VLPAASLQLPETFAVWLSAPEYVFAASQVTGAVTAALSLNVTVTGARYHPVALGARSGVAVTTGAVASYLKDAVAPAWLPAASAQLPVTLTLAPGS
jgi:hypothetical protein